MTLKLLEEFDQYVPPGEAVEPTRKAFSLQFIGALTADYSNQWLLKGLLPRTGLCVVYGPPGSGKSFAVLSLALHVASGRDFAGCRASRKGGVVYVSAEAGEGFKRRAISARDEMGLNDDTPFALVTMAPNLGRSDGDAQALIEAIREQTELAGWHADIIVVDTLARAAQGIDENSSRDMGALVANCDKIANQLSALVVAVHHSGKNTDNGMRGSSALLGAADTVIAISSDEAGTRTARIEKQKDGEDGHAFTFRLQSVTLATDDDGDPVTSCVVTDISKLERAERKTRTGPSVPASLRLWLSVFDEVLADAGRMARPFSDGPEVQTIDRETLKTAFYQRRGDDTPEAKKKAFNRGLNSALDQKIVIATDGEKGVLLWRA
jgi:KaiC/GvpD/RAD55 family RecA-like ATPase